MSFYCNAKVDTISEVNPIQWGNFKIVGLKENYPKNDPIAGYYCKLKNQKLYNLILGILTNNINLVKDNIDNIDILRAFSVITNDPDQRIKLFSVKEAKKYSSIEIQNFIREKYNTKSLNNDSCFWQQKVRKSRGSYFETIPSFDGKQFVKVNSNQFKALSNPISIGRLNIIGVPTSSAAYPLVSSPNFEHAVRLNLNLICAVASGDLNSVKNIVESDNNSISTIPSVITDNLNKLNIDLPFEAEQMGFTEIARYLKNFEDYKNRSDQETVKSIILSGTFVRKDTKMEIEN